MTTTAPTPRPQHSTGRLEALLGYSNHTANSLGSGYHPVRARVNARTREGGRADYWLAGGVVLLPAEVAAVREGDR